MRLEFGGGHIPQDFTGIVREKTFYGEKEIANPEFCSTTHVIYIEKEKSFYGEEEITNP